MAHEYSSYRRPLSKSQRRRRVRLVFAIVLLTGVGLFASFSKAQREHNAIFSKPAAAKTPAPFTVQPEWPTHVAAAAVGAVENGVLATYGDEKPRPIASIAKVITALAILDKHPLALGEQGPAIPITTRDEQRYRDYMHQNGSVSLVKNGVTLSERQALEAMLLPSSNNVADTAAVWAFGNMGSYHKHVNKMLPRLGLKNTVVGGDASGLNPKTKSTASDLVRLGEVALQNPVLADIVAKKQTSNLPVTGPLPNYSRLVTDYGYNGIKIGDSNEAGITLLFSTPHTHNGKSLTLIGVVLGADSAHSPSTNAYKFMESVKTTLTPNTQR